MNLVELAAQWTDEDKARATLEKWRWPNGPACPHCGGVEPYKIKSFAGSKTRKGLYTCRSCRKQFTVTVGTIFEDSHVPLSKWLMAIHLLCASKKGMSAHQLHRMLGVTYRTAWFMGHRLRKAMDLEPLRGQLTGIVEVDETYIGGKIKNPHKAQRRAEKARAEGDPTYRRNTGRSLKTKIPVLSLVQRGGGVRSQVMDRVTAENIKAVLKETVNPMHTRVMTDGLNVYRGLAKAGFQHESVNHAKDEYVRGDVHTNTVEGYYSILKRGVNGTYHHWSRKHLPRYLSEFDFRYNHRKTSDGERAELAVQGAEGKRLTYRPLVHRVAS